MSKVLATKGPHPHLDDLRSINIRNDTLEPAVLSDYLPKNDKPSILWMTRRFGCVLYRGWASTFRSNLPKLHSLGFNTVAVGHEALGVDSWRVGLVDEEKRPFLTSNLAVDSEKRNLNVAMKTSKGSFTSMFSFAMIKLAKVHQKRGISGNYAGDGMQYGGIWIFNAAGECTYGFRQKNYVDFPSPQDIMAEVGLMSYKTSTATTK